MVHCQVSGMRKDGRRSALASGPCAQDALEQRRGALARHRHIDMGIGPIGRERRRQLDHRRGDIGVEIEAGDDRQIRSHQTPQTPQQLALAIGQMGRDHGAMEVEIERIDGTGGGEALQQLAGDALIGLLPSTGPEGVAEHQSSGTEFVALPLGGSDESRGRQIDPVEDIQHLLARAAGPASHRPGRNPDSSPGSGRRYSSRAGSRRWRCGP